MAVTVDPATSVPRTGLPRLSLAERDRRWQTIRAQMAAQGLDVLLVHGDSGKWDQKSANMRYVSQIGGNGEDGWVVFPLEGEPSAHVFAGGAMLKMWNELQDWVSDVRAVPGLRWSHALASRLRDLKLERARVGIVGLSGYQESEGTASYLTLMGLKERLPDAELVDATRLIEDLRMYKSDEEIAFIEEACRIGDAAIRVMRQEARPGVPEYRAYARTMEALLEAGSEQPVTFFWDAGPNVNHGQRYPGRQILQQGWAIVTEISPRYYGHWAHFQAPVAVGGATPAWQKLFDVAYASYQAGLRAFRPGARLRDLARAFEGPIVEAGLTSLHVYAHGTGGRGSDSPVIFPPSRQVGMPPEAQAAFDRVMSIEVKPGMVLAFEPHVSLPDHSMGLHLGDPVVATADGCRRLSQLDLREWASAP